jgi:hypothetical protein
MPIAAEAQEPASRRPREVTPDQMRHGRHEIGIPEPDADAAAKDEL